MSIIFENTELRVSRERPDSGLIATIVNKTQKDILISFPDTDDFFGERFEIKANSTTEILLIEETPNMIQALEQGDFIISSEIPYI